MREDDRRRFPGARLYLVFNLIGAMGLPLLLIGALLPDHALVVVGAVIFGAFMLETAFVLPFLAARRRRRWRPRERLSCAPRERPGVRNGRRAYEWRGPVDEVVQPPGPVASVAGCEWLQLVAESGGRPPIRRTRAAGA